MLAYCITNLKNNKQYIGITTQSLHIRWIEHISRSRYNKSKSAIHSAIRKYSKENFKIEHIACARNIEDLNTLEEILIEQYNTFLCGYNLTPGGNFKIISEETKKRISTSKKGHSVSKETREKLSKITKEQWSRDRDKLISSRWPKLELVKIIR